jgi:uncharacterized membrane protein
MIFAVVCGAFGALASIVAKLALSDHPTFRSITSICEAIVTTRHVTLCSAAVASTRVILFMTMVLLNGLMVTYFLKAMRNNASVVVAVVSTSINFLLTGVLGFIILNEKVGAQWLMGSVLISVGLCFVSIGQHGIPKLRGR